MSTPKGTPGALAHRFLGTHRYLDGGEDALNDMKVAMRQADIDAVAISECHAEISRLIARAERAEAECATLREHRIQLAKAADERVDTIRADVARRQEWAWATARCALLVAALQVLLAAIEEADQDSESYVLGQSPDCRECTVGTSRKNVDCPRHAAERLLKEIAK